MRPETTLIPAIIFLAILELIIYLVLTRNWNKHPKFWSVYFKKKKR